MSNMVPQTAAANVPVDMSAVNALKSAGARAQGGSQFLRFADGKYQIGQSNEEFEGNTFDFIVDFRLIQHGYQCWKGGQPVDEKLTPVLQPMPNSDTLPEHGPYVGERDGWTETRVMPVIILPPGTRLPTQAKFSTSSFGGKNAVDGLCATLADELPTQPEPTAMPRFTAAADSYVNKKYARRIHTPVFTFQGWVTAAQMEQLQQGPAALAAAAKAQEDAATEGATKAAPEDTSAPAPPAADDFDL